MIRKALASAMFMLLLPIVGGHADGQAVNIDLGIPGPPVSATYGSVPGQAGFWNQLVDSGTLRDIDGNATTARLSGETLSTAELTVPPGNEDERRMMSSATLLGLGQTRVGVSGFSPGWYEVYVYCWGGPGYRNSDIIFLTNGFAASYATNLNLPWPGQQVQGRTYVKSRLFMEDGSVSIYYDLPFTGGFAPISGIQVVPVPGPGTAPVLLATGVLASRRRRG